MHPLLKRAFLAEMDSGTRALAAGDGRLAFVHFERAHILGQRHALAHAHAHLAMLRAGWRLRDRREVAGQLPRVLAALLFSRLWVPAGNTGRARISAFRPLPVPADLQAVLDAVR